MLLHILQKHIIQTTEKTNADMMYELADALVHVNQNDKAIEVLKSALSYDKMNEKALPLLAKLYQDEKKGTELSELIKKYKGTKNEALLSDYKVDEPTSSENPGSFEDSVEINLNGILMDVQFITQQMEVSRQQRAASIHQL